MTTPSAKTVNSWATEVRMVPPQHVGDAALDRDVVGVEVIEEALQRLGGADHALMVTDEVHMAVLGDDEAGAPGHGAPLGQAGVVAEGEAHDRPSRACSSRSMCA